MNAGSGKLGRKQEQAIAALLSEPTVEAAAAKAGVAYRTLKGWLTEPVFKAAYATARTAVLERSVANLLKASCYAVAVLQKNLLAPKPSDSNRAAVAILDQAMKGVELLDLAERVEALEAAAKRRGK